MVLADTPRRGGAQYGLGRAGLGAYRFALYALKCPLEPVDYGLSAYQVIDEGQHNVAAYVTHSRVSQVVIELTRKLKNRALDRAERTIFCGTRVGGLTRLIRCGASNGVAGPRPLIGNKLQGSRKDLMLERLCHSRITGRMSKGSAFVTRN